jgi:glycosyltransferase involved in cell wall biosynthesis
MPEPSLTVLMTVYNAMPYLQEAVAGILAQTCRDFDFLIVDNCSTDGSGAFLDQLEQEWSAKGQGQSPRLIIVHLDRNIGRTPVLRLGLERIESDLTAIMDADDFSLPERLERQRAFLAAHPDVDVLGTDVEYMDRAGVTAGRERFPTDHESLRDRLPVFNQFAHSACMFRTAKAKAVGGYPLEFPYAQDLALWIAMFKAGSRAASLAEPLTRIRTHPAQETRNEALSRARAEDDQRLALAMLDIPGISREAQQAACLRSAAALLRLRRYGPACRLLLRAMRIRPWLLPVNKQLLERTRMLLQETKKPK